MNASQAFLSVVSVFLCTASGPAYSDGSADQNTADPFAEQAQRTLLDWAARLTGRTLSGDEPVPRSWPRSTSDLMAQVCPDEPRKCRQLIAAYSIERREILYRESLDPERVFDRSFLVHEYVHYLQHQEYGDQVNASCQKILDNEREAYAAQAAYLRRHNIRFPVNRGLRAARCPAPAEKVARY